ncbi:MAG: protein kinase domain-containing protein, partial [Ktedonobacteraceae bacterium]
MLALEGKQLGNYEVVRRIRVGGMGAVYEGKQRTAFDRRVAIKVILGNYATDRDMRRRFVREARTIARLHHPHILPLIEYGDEQGILYLVMPFIEGGTLTSFLRRSLPDLNEVSAIYQQLLDAVEYAHDEGLIHRDIKSSNVLLEQRRSGTPYAYLADFGLVRTSRQAELERAGKPIPLEQVPGTPHYMAPEQTRGIVTTASDIYALGVLLYQMLTGELPYDDPDEVRVIQMHLSYPLPSPCDHDASIPPELAAVVQKAMAKRVEDRFSSVAELRQAFLAAMQGSPTMFDAQVQAPEILPFPSRPISTPLLPLDPPSPIPPVLELRRANPVAHQLPARSKQRNTNSVRGNQRNTTEPILRPRKRNTLPLIATMIVPIALILLLLVPRALGISLFPVGFPLLGADPTAIVSVMAQSRVMHDTYLLTASPSVKTSDVSTRVIPDRQLQAKQAASSSAATTGTTTSAGVQARGILHFVNSNASTISVPAGVIFTTDAGVQVQTIQTIDVPGRQGRQNGVITTSAVAVNVGSAGNIPAHTLNTKCCGGLSVSNPSAFSGGVDARQEHVVTQSDVNSVSSSLRTQLQKQLTQQLLQQLHTGEVIAGQPTYTTTVSSDKPVGARADDVTVSVTVTASTIVYNRNDVNHIASQLLGKQVTQLLSNNYQLQGTPTVATPQIVKQERDGILYLSVPVQETWVYAFSKQQLNQWKSSIKGASSEAALAFLNEQAGVAAVQIHLPFGTDHLP